MRRKHLIIGCGSAGLSALRQIRAISPEDEIQLVTREDCPPYSPTSLPYLLAGKIEERHLWMRDKTYFETMRCVLTRGRAVAKVMPEEKLILYKRGASDKYDTLLIASGAEPVLPAIKGLDKVGVRGFRTLADCRRLIDEIRDKRDVTVLGAGLIGMELAAALLERGCAVKVIEKLSRILPAYFDAEAEILIRDLFLSRGVQLYTSTEVEDVQRRGSRIDVSLSDGSSLHTQLLISAIGVKASTYFLEGSGIKINRGVVVGNNLSTNIKDIYAAGDVAQAPDFFTGLPTMNPIVPNAVSQGIVAGANMAGRKTIWEGGFSVRVLNVLGHGAVSIGLSMESDDDGEISVLKEANSGEKYYKKMVFKGDQLIGAILVGIEVDPGILLYLIRRQAKLGPLKEALFGSPAEISRWLMLEMERKESAGLQV